MDAQDQARLLAVMQKEAGLWLEALPVPSLSLYLSDNELIASLRLGVPTCTGHTCICNEKVGILGTHGLKCKKSKGRWSRHHSVNDIIAWALTLANIPAILEPLGIVREDNKRPDGMTNISWSHGRHLVWDYTCPDTLAPSHLQATSIEAGSAAKTAEVRKVAKYKTLAVYYTFVPISDLFVEGEQPELLAHEHYSVQLVLEPTLDSSPHGDPDTPAAAAPHSVSQFTTREKISYYKN